MWFGEQQEEEAMEVFVTFQQPACCSSSAPRAWTCSATASHLLAHLTSSLQEPCIQTLISIWRGSMCLVLYNVLNSATINMLDKQLSLICLSWQDAWASAFRELSKHK
jgi:hypothetical protein